MDEVLTRRFQRYLEERDQAADIDIAPASRRRGSRRPDRIDPDTGRPKKFAYPPNLVVVDGGLPQVNAAQSALTALGIDDVAVVGLAKRLEEVWVPGQDFPVILPRTSEGLYLLQRVRDEAHRFAITFHRQRRSKAMTTSVLDGIPGLGETRRKALLREFGSVKRIRAASVEDLQAVPGIGPALATTIAAELATQARRDRPSGEPHDRRDSRRGERSEGSEREHAPGDAPVVRPRDGPSSSVTGMSGAGRSTTANVLEDPAGTSSTTCRRSCWSSYRPGHEETRPVASRATASPLSSTSAARGFFDHLQTVDELRPGVDAQPRSFLDATDEALVRRFESVRRPHPLQGDGRLLDGITRERDLLADLRAVADVVIDTSGLNVHQLAKEVHPVFAGDGAPGCGSPSCRSGSSTASRSTPTSSSTCASCPTRSGSPSCATSPARTRRWPSSSWARRVPGSSSSASSPSWTRSRGLRPRGAALRHARGRLHGGQAPFGGRGRAAGRACERRRRDLRRPP